VKRIKYKQSKEEGVLESSLFLENKRNVLYEVFLDTKSMTYKIVDIINNNSYNSTKPSKNLIRLKVDVKNRLKTLGCQFEPEVRKRNKSIVSKGESGWKENI